MFNVRSEAMEKRRKDSSINHNNFSSSVMEAHCPCTSSSTRASRLPAGKPLPFRRTLPVRRSMSPVVTLLGLEGNVGEDFSPFGRLYFLFPIPQPELHFVM